MHQPPNWRDNLFWPSGWNSHGECTSVYGYTLNRTYSGSWREAIRISWFTKLLYCMDSQPWEDIEFVLKSLRGFNLLVRT